MFIPDWLSIAGIMIETSHLLEPVNTKAISDKRFGTVPLYWPLSILPPSPGEYADCIIIPSTPGMGRVIDGGYPVNARAFRFLAPLMA
jgi:hypothetical protein